MNKLKSFKLILLTVFFFKTMLDTKPGFNTPSKSEKFFVVTFTSSFKAKPSMAELSNGGLSFLAKISFDKILFTQLSTLTLVSSETACSSAFRSENSLLSEVN